MKRLLLALFLLLPLSGFCAGDWDAEGATATQTVAVNIIAIHDNFRAIEDGSAIISAINDTDGDTKVQTEESADEDKVRIDTGGTERALFSGTCTETYAKVNKHSDIDGDTFLQVEEASDEDKIRADIAGTEKMLLSGTATESYIKANKYSDSDADTFIQVEETADEDKIRVDIGGTEKAIFGDGTNEAALEIVNNGTGKSIYINHTGAIGNNESAFYMASSTAQNPPTGYFFNIAMTNAASNIELMRLTNNGSGYTIYESTTGANLSPAGVWTNASSKKLKENFTSVDVLDKVMSLPVQQYNYKKDSLVKHFGPCAEDFHATFDLGDDKGVAGSDVAGIALRAVQELNNKIEDLEKRIEKLEK